mmetsp:Transcript_10305/g.21665  ORF Transcript_10305/g.21665 Transcript_10305/m.21665 type:complete len:423 (+) Transcript_10305:45-1313(+)
MESRDGVVDGGGGGGGEGGREEIGIKENGSGGDVKGGDSVVANKHEHGSEKQKKKEQEDDDQEVKDDQEEEKEEGDDDDDEVGQEEDVFENAVSGASAWLFGTLSSIAPPAASTTAAAAAADDDDIEHGDGSDGVRSAARDGKEREEGEEHHQIHDSNPLLSAANQVTADVSSGLTSLGKFVDTALEDGSVQVDYSNITSWFASASVSSSAQVVGDRSAYAKETPAERLRARFGGSNSKRGGAGAEDAMLDESVLDAFECALVQKYRCYHNSLTPERIFPHLGTLFVTESHIAFAEEPTSTTAVTNTNTNATATLPFASIASSLLPSAAGQPQQASGEALLRVVHTLGSVQRIQSNASGSEQQQLMRVVLDDKSSLIFGSFRNTSEYNAASTLLKHIKESLSSSESNNTPAAAEKEHPPANS